TTWAKALDSELARAQENYKRVEGESAERTAWALNLNREIDAARADARERQAEAQRKSDELAARLKDSVDQQGVLQGELDMSTRAATALRGERDDLLAQRATLQVRLEDHAARLRTLEEGQQELKHLLEFANREIVELRKPRGAL